VQIITVQSNRYAVVFVTEAPPGIDANEWVKKIKKRHALVDTAINSNNSYYFCMELINAEYEEIENESTN
tara:strand:+ start:188 stop:397 length:210 start_codon:yes stop_codon:yes gene_type:complete